MQLIVLGMHRSGTSMLTGLLNMMGAYFGPEDLSIGANDENRKGFWERQDIIELNQNFLESYGADWYKISKSVCRSFPDSSRFKEKAVEILADLDEHRPWVIKDPRLCLLFPLWKDLLEIPICIHIYRAPIQTAESLKIRNGFPVSVGIALWEKYNISALAASKDVPRLLVHHRDLLTHPIETTKKLTDELQALGVHGLRLPHESTIKSFVDNSLFRARKPSSLHRSYLNKRQSDLVNSFEKRTILERKTTPSLSAGAVDILRHFDDTESLRLRNRQLEERIRELDDTLLKLRGRNQQLENRIQTLDETSLRLRGRNEQLEDRIQTLDENSLQLRGRNAELEDRIQTLDETSSQLRGRNEQLEDRIQTLDETSLQLRSRNEQLEDKIQTLDETSSQLRGRNEQLEDRIQTLIETSLQLQSRNEQREDRIRTLDEASLQLQGRSEQLEDRIQTLDEASLQLRGRNEQLEDRIRTLDEASMQLQGRNDQLEDRIRTLDEASMQLRGRNEQLEDRIRTLDEASMQLRGRNEQLEDRIRTLDEASLQLGDRNNNQKTVSRT